MLAGAPVVLPNAGAFPEIIQSTGGGKLYQLSLDGALTKALDELISDPENAKLIGMQAHREVQKKYSNEVLAKKLIEEVVSQLPMNPKQKSKIMTVEFSIIRCVEFSETDLCRYHAFYEFLSMDGNL